MARISSTVKPSPPSTSDASTIIPRLSCLLDAPRTAHQARGPVEGQQHSPVMPEKAWEETAPTSLDGPASPNAGQWKHPEENAAAAAIATAPIQRRSKTSDILGQEARPRLPPQPVMAEPEQTVQSKEALQSACYAGDYGTSVKFVKDPQEAFRQAGEQKKIVFLLHLSGNFEDANFT